MSQFTPKQYQYIKFQQEYKRNSVGVPCHLCGLPIDHQAPRNSKGQWTLDHIIPLSMGGDPKDPANCAPAHRGCNGKRGNKPHIPVPDQRPLRPVVSTLTPKSSRCYGGCSCDGRALNGQCARVVAAKARWQKSPALSS